MHAVCFELSGVHRPEVETAGSKSWVSTDKCLPTSFFPLSVHFSLNLRINSFLAYIQVVRACVKQRTKYRFTSCMFVPLLSHILDLTSRPQSPVLQALKAL